MGTKKDENSQIDEDAVHVVEGILRGKDWNRSKPQPDNVGLDLRLDLLKDRHPEIAFYLQIKGVGQRTSKGVVQPIVSPSGTLNKAIELEHLDYYMKLPIPVFLVVVDVVRGVAYYTHIQRYIVDNLSGDGWRNRLHEYHVARERGDFRCQPTKTIRVPIENILGDSERFKQVVEDARRYMASLGVDEGIAYQEETLSRLDERFTVTYVRTKEGDRFQIDANQPVEFSIRGTILKSKFDDLFGRGLAVPVAPGELTIEGSPLWEKIAAEAQMVQIKREFDAIVSIIRRDISGQRVASLDLIPCKVEGGMHELRFRARLPHELLAFTFNLDLREINASSGPTVPFTTTFGFQSNLGVWLGQPLLALPYLDQLLTVFGKLEDDERFCIELGIHGLGKVAGLTLDEQATRMFARLGQLYETMERARAIASYFKINPKLPVTLERHHLSHIDMLYDLIQGREVPNQRRLSVIRVHVEREPLAIATNSSSKPDVITPEMCLQLEAHFPFLDQSVHVDNLVLLISGAKMLTRKSDISRQLKSGRNPVPLRFVATSESKQILKLTDLPRQEPDSPSHEIGSNGSGPVSSAAAPKLWRSLVRVVGISTVDAERMVEAVVPSWDPGRTVRFRESLLPDEIQFQLVPGVRLLADVSLGETDPEKLIFRDFRLAPQPA
jgi:hypothetical protein